MIKIVTSEEMRGMDSYTIEELGIPGAVLMENAGKGVFQVIQGILENLKDFKTVIFCGKGNNGGDGFVIGRYLWNEGVRVEFFMVGNETDIKGDARINYEVIRKLNIPVHFVNKKSDLTPISQKMPDLIVDALLGTGITGAVYGFMKDVIEFINELDCPVLSVDVPSGLNSDLPAVEGEVVKADITVTMALPKHCHVFYPAKNYVGELYVVDIGIPNDRLNDRKVKTQIIEADDIHMPARARDTHKYLVGKVAVLAGSTGFTGAATLASDAALHAGAGLVILGIPHTLNHILEMKMTEVITKPYTQEVLTSADDPIIKELLDWGDVLAIGPGLGRSAETQQAIIDILARFDKPAIIDADALFALAQHPQLLKKPHPDWILTPHHGEFYRLLEGVEKKDFQTHFVSLARDYAVKHRLVLMLKGAPSLVAAPDGQVYVNSTGNPGLASGGTGDVLTGLAAGLRVQGMDAVTAAYTAHYIHGICADEIVERTSTYSLTAAQLIDELGAVTHKIVTRHEENHSG
jgi:hydroxyethylthiazole kinase-like uncharacterized protein yjeF